MRQASENDRTLNFALEMRRRTDDWMGRALAPASAPKGVESRAVRAAARHYGCQCNEERSGDDASLEV